MVAKNTLTASFLAPSTRDEGQGEAETVCQEFGALDGARVSGKGCGHKPESDFTCFIIFGDRASWQGQHDISESAWPGSEPGSVTSQLCDYIPLSLSFHICKTRLTLTRVPLS